MRGWCWRELSLYERNRYRPEGPDSGLLTWFWCEDTEVWGGIS